jgi:hypothetical protein
MPVILSLPIRHKLALHGSPSLSDGIDGSCAVPAASGGMRWLTLGFMPTGRYGKAHQQLRQRMLAAFVSGQPCAICGRPLEAVVTRGSRGELTCRDVALAHNESDTGYLGAAHPRCNSGMARIKMGQRLIATDKGGPERDRSGWRYRDCAADAGSKALGLVCTHFGPGGDGQPHSGRCWSFGPKPPRVVTPV